MKLAKKAKDPEQDRSRLTCRFLASRVVVHGDGPQEGVALGDVLERLVGEPDQIVRERPR